MGSHLDIWQYKAKEFQKYKKMAKYRFFVTFSIIVTLFLSGSILFFQMCLWAYQPSAVANFHTPSRYTLGKTLILVPHQDDEANLLSGILDLLSNQNEVYIAFSTNGDFHSRESGVPRVKEALDYAAHHHIPQNHVIYLGYGDGYDPNSRFNARYKHLYNAEIDERMTAHSGRSETEGSGEMPCFRPSKPLTRRNFKNDITDLIKSIMPDTMIVVDYDAHPDHRALSCMFEEALADVLKSHPQYTPTVLKGFAYSTAWYGPFDYYSYNLLSTRAWNFKPNDQDKRMSEVNWAWWADRIRFPVSAEAAAEDVDSNNQFIGLKKYAARNPAYGKIVSGDRVFWWRPTNSVLKDAMISCSSGNAAALTDFKLSDSEDITDIQQLPTKHGWYPDHGRGSVSVSFPTPRVIQEIRLYDDTEMSNRVLKAKVTLSNGKIFEVSDFDEGGVAKRIPTDCHEPISGYSVEITDGIGKCGFAEMEAFSEIPRLPFQIIKMMDEDGDFMYTYHTGICGNVPISLWGSPDVNTKDCRLIQKEGTVDIQKEKGGQWLIHVPYGESATVQVLNAHSVPVDQVFIHHPTLMQQIGRHLHQANAFMRYDFPIIKSKIVRRVSRLF